MSIAVLLGILGLNSLLQKAYGTSEGSTGSNFSYVLCGLSMGTGWEGCPAKLAAEGEPLEPLKIGEAAASNQLYSLAWKNFRARPEVFFGRLADGVGAFVSGFPGVIWRGYRAAIGEPSRLFRNALTAISLMGLVYIAARRAKSVELTFWVLIWASIVASSSMIYFDDGPRALAASHPLMALFFAIGMSSPESTPGEAASRSHLSRYGSLGLIVTAALFVCVPWIAHRFSPIGAMDGSRPISKQGEAFVFGGRRMSGFLVVEDGLPLRSDVPTLHLADFKALIEESAVENDQGLLHPVTPTVAVWICLCASHRKGRFQRQSIHRASRCHGTPQHTGLAFQSRTMATQTGCPRRLLVLRHEGGTLALTKSGPGMRPYFPHTSPATSTASFSFAHCSSSVRTLPSSVEAKPHCGDSAS